MQQCLFESADLPAFVVNSNQITLIDSPKTFYNTLLVKAISDAVRDRQVRVLILLDASRSTRRSGLTGENISLYPTTEDTSHEEHRYTPANSSTELLAPLAASNLVSVALFHNPHLRGWLYRLLPARLNEVLGVQHIKALVVDDSVLLTGANMSHDYFTNRQDRVWLFKRVPSLANFYHGLINVISRFSYRLHSDESLKPWTCDMDPKTTELFHFKRQFQSAITTYLDTVSQSHSNPGKYLQPNATYVFPLIQLGSHGLRQEEHVTTRLLHAVASETTTNRYALSWASGYFNLTRAYQSLLLNFLRARSDNELDFICASPHANGFLNSHGLSGFIPLAYRELLIGLLKRFEYWGTTQYNPIIREYVRPNWTFHAKGLWIEQQCIDPLGEKPSSLTMIGSSNFGYRSLNRDLEHQLIVLTRDVQLRKRMNQERSFLFNPVHTEVVTLAKLQLQSQFRLPWYMRFLQPLLHTYM